MQILNTLTKAVPTFFGGSADLASSNKTYLDEGGDFEKGNYAGRNFRFGVREHGMAGICNGAFLSAGSHVLLTCGVLGYAQC